MSEFAAWFESQCGKRGHYKRFLGTADEELKDIVAAAKDAEFELSQRWIWDSKHQFALYAWQAAPTQQEPQ